MIDPAARRESSTDQARSATRAPIARRLAALSLGVCAALAACGRLGFDAAGTSPLDAPGGPEDAAPDVAVAVCPPGTTETHAGGAVCVEQAQRGSATWTDAKLSCSSLGRRLCSDAEWLDACTNATPVTGMTGDDWEWVAEEMSGVAQKRGSTACDDTATHEILIAPYGYRCCVDL